LSPPLRLMNRSNGSSIGLCSSTYRRTRDHLDRVRLSTFAGSAVQRMIAAKGSSRSDGLIFRTLARDFDLREIGLLYYVMASSQTLGEALKRVARYSKATNEALVFGYQEGNRLVLSLTYSGVPRHSDRHQIEFCMFAVLRICRVLTAQNLVPQHFSISHHRSRGTSEMGQFVGRKVEFGADTDEFSLNADTREWPLIHSDPYLNDLLLKYCETTLARSKR
jgi:Arabinose-binding domain of AraC transcription regulator, N-term